MRLVGWLFLAAMVAGCEGFAPPMPDWIVNRQPLDSCAEGIVEDGSPEAEVAQRCMLDAYGDGRGAELVTSGQMETGDPMTTYLRVHRNGTIEVFRNLGGDPNAPGAWERMRCENLVPTDLVRGPAEGAFTVTGCEMLPLP
ncbi:MAG TPA: hypothetical protein VFP30_03960 [Candidatus Limnocylindria bacterium]|nr:hypothetical protein [Candidatus Limnocylindria bacterium]